MFSREG